MSLSPSVAPARKLCRVLMTTTVYPRWQGDPTPSFVRHLALGLAEKGHAVTVLAPHGAGARLEEARAGVRVVRYRYFWPAPWQALCYGGGMLVRLRERPWRWALLPSFLLSQGLALRRLLREERFDLLHAHSILPQGLVARVFGGRKLPLVVTSHGGDVFGLPEHGILGALKRDVVRQASAITVNSRATGEAVARLGAEPCRIHRIPATPNTVTPDPALVDHLRTVGGPGPRLLLIGRLIEEKGIAEYIQAVAVLRKRFPGLIGWVAGTGEGAARYQAQAEELGAASAVCFLGWLEASEVASYLAAADVLVAPSKPGRRRWQEAQGLAVVEAMFARTPVVASDIGGIPDMVVHGETGLLVPPGEARALATAVESLLRSPEKARSLADKAHAHAMAGFSPEVVRDATEALYFSLLSP